MSLCSELVTIVGRKGVPPVQIRQKPQHVTLFGSSVFANEVEYEAERMLDLGEP